MKYLKYHTAVLIAVLVQAVLAQRQCRFKNPKSRVLLRPFALLFLFSSTFLSFGLNLSVDQELIGPT